MSHLRPIGINSYEATRDAAINKIKKAADDSDNELLESVAEENDPKKEREREKNCQAVQMIVSRCLENYRNGEYTFSESVDMLCDAFKKLK